jgi:hypothetical protein
MPGKAAFPTLSSAPDDAVESPAVDADLRDGQSVPQKDRDDVRKTLAESRVGVDVAEGVGEAVGREDFVEEDGHLVAEMTAGAGQKLIVGLGDGAAEEHGRK